MAEVAPPITQIEPCPACAHANERPWLFCAQCGAARARLSHWRVMINLSVTFSCLLAASYYHELLIWNWPLFSLFFFYLLQFTLALAHGRWRLRLRLAMWLLTAFVISIAGFTNLHLHGWGTVFLDLNDVIPLSRQYPLIFWPIAGAIAAAFFIPVYFRWGRLYGWVMAYRLLILLGVAICATAVGGLRALDWVHSKNILGEEQEFLRRFLKEAAPHYDAFFVLLGVTLIRVFIFEIIVYSAVHGYARVARAARAARPAAPGGDSGFARSLTAISRVVMRLVQTVENMTKYLLATARDLGRDSARAAFAILREAIIPTAMMAALALLLYRLTQMTDGYIREGRLEAILGIMASLLGVLLAALLFLWCKSRVRWSRLAAFYGQMTGWLVPNLLLFFLLISLTLAASSYALRRFVEEDQAAAALTFRVGWLTWIDAGVLLALVAFVMVRKSRQLRVEEDTGAGAGAVDGMDATDAMDKNTLAGVAGALDTPAKDPARKLPLRQRLIPAPLRRQAARLQTSDAMGAIHQTMEDITLRVKGKPAAIADLARVKAELAEQERKIAALEARRTAVSGELFQQLRREYDTERRRLAARRDDLQAEVDQMHLRQSVKVEEARLKIDLARRRRAEVEPLRAAGAIDEARAAALLREAERDIETNRLLLEGCEQVLAWMAEEATSAPAPSSEPSSGAPASDKPQ